MVLQMVMNQYMLVPMIKSLECIAIWAEIGPRREYEHSNIFFFKVVIRLRERLLHQSHEPIVWYNNNMQMKSFQPQTDSNENLVTS